MRHSTRFRLAVAGAALTGCAVGGVAFGPTLAGALQDDSSTTTVVDESTETTEVPESTTDDSTTDESTGDAEDCGPGGRGPGGRGPGFEAAAEAIGIEVEDLREALMGGETIAEVAEANGVAVADVVAAMVAEAQEHLAEGVEEGRITQERADEMAAELEERITDLVNGELPARGQHGPGFPGRPGGAGADDPEADAGS